MRRFTRLAPTSTNAVIEWLSRIFRWPVVVRRLGAALAEVVLIGRFDVDAIALEP